MKKGRALERLVETVERALSGTPGVKIESPKSLEDRITGGRREHDVVLTFSSGHHELIVAIECRDRSRVVTVNDVESFWSKCQDTGTNRGIIVSPKGFSKAAVAKARVRGIGCLSLAQAKQFNWLLVPGVRLHNRKIPLINWTLIPATALTVIPPQFTVLDPTGRALSPEQMRVAAHQEFMRHSGAFIPVGRRRARITFTAPGVSVRDDATGSVHPVQTAIADVEYEVTEHLTPFQLMTYTDHDSGSLITDAAVADLDLDDMSGRLVIVYKEDEGGRVVFMPNRGDSMANDRLDPAG
jgi:hypothetical protein